MLRLRTAFVSALCLAVCGCQVGDTEEGAGETEAGTDTATEASASGTDSSGSETSEGATSDSEGPPLDNGPSGDATVDNSCAPDDGLAWAFRIGLTAACDAAQPDPSEPYVTINIYDSALFETPVGTTSEWTDWMLASGSYAPEGSEGEIQSASAGSLHIESWEGQGEVGSTLSGWYTLTLGDDTQIGGSFTATFCGGDPMCG